MAVVMSMHWPEATLDQYEQVRNQVKWETDYPEGAMFHVAWIAADGFRVIDLWGSPEQFQRFMDTRLAPAIAQANIQGQPNVQFSPAHAIFAPNVPRPAAARKPAARRPARKAAAKAKKAKAGKSTSKAKSKKRGKR